MILVESEKDIAKRKGVDGKKSRNYKINVNKSDHLKLSVYKLVVL